MTRYQFVRWWLLLSILLLEACTGTTILSDEEPYRSMIGDCYILQHNMNVYENGCWDIGDLVLSPDEHSCFKRSRGTVPEGSKITISEVKRKQFGTAGPCPQIVVTTEEFDVKDRSLYIPLCFSRSSISWLEDKLWYRGDDIKLKEKYVKRCENARTSKMGESDLL